MATVEAAARKIKLHDLTTFVGVVDAGGMRKAAIQLHMSQSAVSKSVAALEQALGVKLLSRSRQGVEPTRYGDTLLRRSTAIFDELNEGVNEIRFLADPGSGQLRVGCTETIARGFMPRVVTEIAQLHKRLMFRIEVGTTRDLQFHFLRERLCEAVIARPWEPVDRSIRVEPLFNERLYVVVGRHSPWARRRKVALHDLVGERWILSQHEVAPGSPVQRAFSSAGLDAPEPAMVSGSLNMRNALLRDRRYVTMMPDSLLCLEINNAIRVLPIDIPRWQTATSLMTLKARALSPMGELFVARARELGKRLRSACADPRAQSSARSLRAIHDRSAS